MKEHREIITGRTGRYIADNYGGICILKGIGCGGISGGLFSTLVRREADDLWLR